VNMYEFIKNQWLLGRYAAENLARCVAKGYLTQAQADTIGALARGAAA